MLIPIGISREYISNMEKRSLKDKSLFAWSLLYERIPVSGKTEISNYISEYLEASGDSITVYDNSGNAIARPSGILSNFNVHISLPISNNGRLSGTIGIDHFSPGLKEEGEEVIVGMAVLLAVTLCIIALVLIVISRRKDRFKQAMLAAMENFSGGNYNARIFPGFKGDQRTITDCFNNFAELISSFFRDLLKEKEELETLVSSLSSGIAVIDKRGKITLSNRVYNNIFNNPAVIGRYFWEIMINARISDLITKVQKEERSASGEISYLNRYYHADLIYIKENMETVLMLSDITDSKNLEKIKKDFVDNVSHELKTPLTSIKGFTESLIALEKNPDKKHKLGIILRNSERLNNIVQDLLKISELEETSIIIKPEKISIAELLQNAALLFTDPLKKKNLTLEIKSDKELPLIEGDPYKLEQLFVNLIDNAVKYTDSGGIYIRVFPENDSVIVEIEDTGIGIHEEHIPRLFERFYVVDKARSKSTGGTGLGLSIAKHIVLLHRGRIGVQSRQGKGTVFIITLPLSL